MTYLLANRQPCNRDEDETGRAEPQRPDTGVKPDADRANVIALPALAPPEIEPQAWHPPKEVIWMGRPHTVVAMSLAIAARLTEPAASSG